MLLVEELLVQMLVEVLLAVANEYARKDSYLGGVTIWIHEFNQSMNHKESFAMKLAEILRENGIKANDGSRLD